MIKIDDLIPLLKPGFVAMDKGGTWVWYSEKPIRRHRFWARLAPVGSFILLSDGFEIAPFSGDWEDSLIEIKAKEGTPDPTNTKGE